MEAVKKSECRVLLVYKSVNIVALELTTQIVSRSNIYQYHTKVRTQKLQMNTGCDMESIWWS